MVGVGVVEVGVPPCVRSSWGSHSPAATYQDNTRRHDTTRHDMTRHDMSRRDGDTI